MIDIIIIHDCLIELIMMIYFLHSLVIIDCGARLILNSGCVMLCFLLFAVQGGWMPECLIYSSMYFRKYCV